MLDAGCGTGRVSSALVARGHTDGVVVTGFSTDRGYSVAEFDRDLAEAGLRLEHRFATWDLRPWHDDAAWATSVLRVAG